MLCVRKKVHAARNSSRNTQVFLIGLGAVSLLDAFFVYDFLAKKKKKLTSRKLGEILTHLPNSTPFSVEEAESALFVLVPFSLFAFLTLVSVDPHGPQRVFRERNLVTNRGFERAEPHGSLSCSLPSEMLLALYSGVS